MDLDDPSLLGTETVYGTHEDYHVVMSEKVQSLAGSIYQEFERMIARYDEDVVKTLMPLLVNVLECLDAAYQTNQEHDVELELLREDNEQLVTQYEREKGARKAAEQKLLEFEDASEGERKEMTTRMEALESIARMLELKHKNSMEHAGRLEEREGELKKEYSKLHERYTDLFKTHMDYMERTKLLLSGGQLANERTESNRLNANRLSLGRSSGPISFGFASLEAAEGMDSVPTSPISSCHSSPSLHSELDNVNSRDGIRTVEKAQETDSVNHENKSVITSPISPQPPPQINTNSGRVQTKKEQRSANTLYQELSFQDADALADMDDGADITGGWVHPGEYASSVNDNFYGMGKEVENLIMENNELLATKNALNVVKDDLIVKVDELTGELEMLREEMLSMNLSKAKIQKRMQELEDELRKLREANETKPDSNDEEADVPMAQRKRFTRVEMARVLMERNQYKERFMELQDAVRWTEMLRASRNDVSLDKKSKQSIWKFFSNLFTSSEQPSRPMTSVGHMRYQAGSNQVAPGVRALPRNTNDFLDTELGQGSEKMQNRRAVERREQYRHVRAHVRKEDGRMQAYGWSLPGKVGSGPKGAQNNSGVPVPVPVYCRPLAETSPGMMVFCAAGVNLLGGYTKDGGLMVGGSVFYSEESVTRETRTTEVESLDKELEASREAALLETQLSSLVWICTSTQAASIVTVIDANNPAEILNSFGVCASHLLCIASVPGASLGDYDIEEPSLVARSADSFNVDQTKDSRNNNDSSKVNENTKNDASTQNDKSQTDGSNDGKNGAKNGAKDEPESRDDGEKPKPVIGRVTFVEKNPSVYNRRDEAAKRAQETDFEETNRDHSNTDYSHEHNSNKNYSNKDNSDRDNSSKENSNKEDSNKEDSNKEDTNKEATNKEDTKKRYTNKGDTNKRDINKEDTDKVKEGVAREDIESSMNSNTTKESNESEGTDTSSESNKSHDYMSSVLATMWLGAQNGMIYVHSSVANWNQCLHSVKLQDSVIGIVHLNGCVVAAIANGTVVVFRRGADGEWDLSRYHIVELGIPQHSVRRVAVVGDKVWCGIKNMVHILEPRQLKVVHSFEAHPRTESQVRELAWLGEGVWISIRLDSTLRLYHAYTYEHLQDVDIEPYVSKMLGTGKLGFSLVRITTLLISCNRLWIGTSNGVIISVPLSETGGGSGAVVTRGGGLLSSGLGGFVGAGLSGAGLSGVLAGGHLGGYSGGHSGSQFGGQPGGQSGSNSGGFLGFSGGLSGGVLSGAGQPCLPGGVMRVVPVPGSFIPYCTMAHAQLSFHGHRDVVKFFVAVPGNGGMSAASTPSEAHSAAVSPTGGQPVVRPPKAMLVMSGGEGYIDFRIGDGEMEDSVIGEDSGEPDANQGEAKELKSHLIVWQVGQG